MTKPTAKELSEAIVDQVCQGPIEGAAPKDEMGWSLHCDESCLPLENWCSNCVWNAYVEHLVETITDMRKET